MDPFTLALTAVSVGTQLFSAFSGASHAKEAYGVQQDMARQEQNINDQKTAQMELSAKRQSLEQFRVAQRLRAQGVNAAVNQGASLGSGLPGGEGQNSGQLFTNLSGINQNLQFGRTIGQLNNNISQDKIRLGGIQGEMATDQAIGQVGSAIGKSAGPLGNIFASFGKPSGNASGTPGAFNTGGLY